VVPEIPNWYVLDRNLFVIDLFFPGLIQWLPLIDVNGNDQSAGTELVAPDVDSHTVTTQRELRTIMYDYIKFGQHSKRDVAFTQEAIDMLTPGQKHPGLKLSLRSPKNGGLMKASNQP
jgi:hypothetical protein